MKHVITLCIIFVLGGQGAVNFSLESVNKRPQNSAGHNALVYSFPSFVSCDGGLPSGGHLFPPAGHLLELHQSNVSLNIYFWHFMVQYLVDILRKYENHIVSEKGTTT